MDSILRLSRETIGVFAKDGRKLIVRLPAGAEVVVPSEIAPIRGELANRQVIVHWRDKAVLVFASDIRERGEAVESHARTVEA